MEPSKKNTPGLVVIIAIVVIIVMIISYFILLMFFPDFFQSLETGTAKPVG